MSGSTDIDNEGSTTTPYVPPLYNQVNFSFIENTESDNSHLVIFGTISDTSTLTTGFWGPLVRAL